MVGNHRDGKNLFKFKYSTTKEYLESVHEAQKTAGFEWPVYKGDFFPLTSNFPAHTWSGYFTSRPNLKYQIRQFSAVSQISQTFYGLQVLDSIRKKDPQNSLHNAERFRPQISSLRENNAKMMHHDAITGTSLIYIVYNETLGMQ